MNIYGLAVRNRTTVLFLTLLIVIGGLYSYFTLPLEAAPDITIPNVFITTSYRGASPEDIEKGITIPIEDEIQGLSGVKEITSVSSEGQSSINVEFVTGTDIDQVLTKVKDRVDRAKQDLPNDLEDDPFVQELNISEMPILVLILSGDCGLRQLTELADDLADELETIPGVLEVGVSGKVVREIQIQLWPDRLAMYGISFQALQSAVAGANKNTSAGFFRTTEGRYQLRIPGEIQTVEELEGLVVAMRSGSPVYLRDVARIVDGLKDRRSISRTNGRDSINLAIKKRVGENIVRIVDAVDEVVDKLKPAWPPGTKVYRLMDQAKNIRSMLSDLQNNILSGLILVVIVVSLVMGFRNGILVSLSIPLSMLLSFMVLKALGITLNMVVLFSLTLALGMLVDNAVVIIENIYRFMQQGVPAEEAAIAATSEVGLPIIGSALTTIGAFVPLLAWTGIMGGFMVFLPKTVIITLASCLFVALIINPASAAIFMKVHYQGPPRSAADITSGGEHPMLSGGGWLIRGYRRVLRFALQFRLAVVATALLVTLLLGMLWFWAVGLRTPLEFFPAVDPDAVYVNITPPVGADLDYSDALVRRIAMHLYDPRVGTPQEAGNPVTYGEAIQLKSHRYSTSGKTYQSPLYLPDVEYAYEKAGAGSGLASFFGGNSATQIGLQFVDLADRERSSSMTMNMVQERLRDIAGAKILVEAQKEGPPTGAPISIEIRGHDFPVLGALAKKVRELVRRVPYTRNVRHDFEEGTPTIRVIVNRKRAGLFGLTVGDVGYVLKAAFNGINISTYREGEDEHDIVARLVDEDRRAIDTLRQLMIPTPQGRLVPLTTLCDIQYVGGVGRITRVDRRRVVTVKADVDTTKTTGVTARLMAEQLLRTTFQTMGEGEQSGGLLPPGYSYQFTGEQQEQQKSQDFLSWAMGVALLIILFVLVAQFNSVLYPLIILSAVFLSLSGVFLGLAAYRMPFGVIMTGVGVISLAGVVVNNAIVLLDYILKLMERGMELRDAIVAAGATRLRPVLLTAITTILGLIPMVTGVSFDFATFQIQWVSESSQWWSSMAVAVIFGLGLATLLTLFVVPVLFSLSQAVRRAK